MDGETLDGNSNGNGESEFPTIILDGNGERSSGIPTLDPATASDPAIDPDTGKRKSGRPRKDGTNSARTAASKQSTKEVSADLTSILLSVHFMLAKLTNVAELELEEDEAKKLGDAVARVNKEFGVQIMSPKTAALVNLAMVGGAVYGPRAIAVLNNAKKKKKGNGVVVIDNPSAAVM
jgi:hypothetical protein